METSADAILEHAEWARSLARALVLDPNRADDLVQQSLLEALRNPPRELRSPRGWLARSLRNIAADHGRRDARRRAREQVAAQPEHTSTTDPAGDTAETLRLHRELLEAVQGLAEPYRTVLTLRYLESMPPRQIAARLARPINTVRTQVERGLAQLRDTFDQRHGDRAAWCTALLPLLRPGASAATIGSSALTLGGILMTWKLLLPTAMGLALWAWMTLGPATEDAPRPDAIARTDPSAATAAPKLPKRSPSEAQAARVATPSRPSTPTAEPIRPVLRGRVLTVGNVDVRGLRIERRAPLAYQTRDGRLFAKADGEWFSADATAVRNLLARPSGHGAPGRHRPDWSGIDQRLDSIDYALLEAIVNREPAGESARIGSDQRFELGIRPSASLRRLFVASPSHAVYGASHAPEDDQTDAIVVVGPAARVRGQVVDTDGRPIPGAMVSMQFETSHLIDGEYPELKHVLSWETATDTSGSFDLGRLPSLGSLTVEATKVGYAATETSAQTVPSTGQPMTFVLRADDRSAGVKLAGVVLDAAGNPVPNATVTYRFAETSTGPDGRFRLHWKQPLEHPSALFAFRAGHQHASIPQLNQKLATAALRADEIVLRLGPAPLQIRGRLEDAKGAPVAGWSVQLLEGESMSNGSGWAESRSLLELRAADSDNDDSEGTATDGTFTIGGLKQRSYRLRFFDWKTLAHYDTEPIRAGTTIERSLPSGLLLDQVRGRVVCQGKPVSNAKIEVHITAPRGDQEMAFSRAAGARSEADGSFTIKDVPRDAKLMIRSVQPHAIFPRRLPVTEVLAAGGQIEIERPLRVRLRPATDPKGSEFEVRDVAGKPLRFVLIYPNLRASRRRSPLDAADRAPLLVLPQAATRLVIFRDGRVAHQLNLPSDRSTAHEIALP